MTQQNATNTVNPAPATIAATPAAPCNPAAPAPNAGIVTPVAQPAKPATTTGTPAPAKTAAKRPARKGKGKAAKGTKGAPGTKKPAPAKGKGKAAKVPAKHPRKGSKVYTLFTMVRRKAGATNGQCNAAYWPDGKQAAGWGGGQGGLTTWAAKYGYDAYHKAEGRAKRYYLRTKGEGAPAGATRVAAHAK